MPNVDESKELMGFLEAKRIHRIMRVSKANNPETKSCKGHFSCTEHSPFNTAHSVDYTTFVQCSMTHLTEDY